MFECGGQPVVVLSSCFLILARNACGTPPAARPARSTHDAPPAPRRVHRRPHAPNKITPKKHPHYQGVQLQGWRYSNYTIRLYRHADRPPHGAVGGAECRTHDSSNSSTTDPTHTTNTQSVSPRVPLEIDQALRPVSGRRSSGRVEGALSRPRAMEVVAAAAAVVAPITVGIIGSHLHHIRQPSAPYQAAICTSCSDSLLRVESISCLRLGLGLADPSPSHAPSGAGRSP